MAYKFVNKFILIAAGAGILILVFFAAENWSEKKSSQSQGLVSSEVKNPEASEIQEIREASSPHDQVRSLRKLLSKVGPEATQEALYRSGLPFTGQTHLLIHTIGDFLYENFGTRSIIYCKDYFLSACYHGTLIHIIADFGIEGVVEAMGRCQEAGLHVVTQCAHAIGHGLLAWTDYELLETLALCDEVGRKTGEGGFPYFNCYDGVFMENLWGVHNGVPSPKRWVKEDDLYYPCNDSRIPIKYLNGCWANQATLIYQRFNGDLKKTAQACDGVLMPEYQKTCYHNFARQIHPLSQGQAEKVFELCQNASGAYWQNFCLITILGAAFSVGDQEKLPFEICRSMGGHNQAVCYQELLGLIQFYAQEDLPRRQELCKRILEESWQEKCLAQTI